jgi:hypothetical protein
MDRLERIAFNALPAALWPDVTANVCVLPLPPIPDLHTVYTFTDLHTVSTTFTDLHTVYTTVVHHRACTLITRHHAMPSNAYAHVWFVICWWGCSYLVVLYHHATVM